MTTKPSATQERDEPSGEGLCPHGQPGTVNCPAVQQTRVALSEQPRTDAAGMRELLQRWIEFHHGRSIRATEEQEVEKFLALRPGQGGPA